MEKIKEFLTDFIEKLMTERKLQIITGAAALGIIIVIVLVSVLLHGKNKYVEVPEEIRLPEPTATVAPSPTPTVTPTPAPTATPTPTPEPTPTPNLHIGEVQSALDGQWIAEETAAMRPYAIMFNNIGVANPQSGVGEAKVLYEALVEAGITRLMGVFEGLDENSSCAERIGSVRSARHYYASIADEWDAIFIHFGETTYATKKIDKLKLDHLEGIYGVGSTVFYRDNTIKAPHNAFASIKGIWAGIKQLKLRDTHKDDFEPQHFKFLDPDESYENTVIGVPATYISLPYSTYMSPYFTYDEETKLYTRYQFGDVHIDYNTGEPLTFKNIIIQIVHEYDKDKNGYQTMDIEKNDGNGFYITDGMAVPITWSKSEKKKTMMYYDADGNPLVINPGKTFISVFPDFRESRLSFVNE